MTSTQGAAPTPPADEKTEAPERKGPTREEREQEIKHELVRIMDTVSPGRGEELATKLLDAMKDYFVVRSKK